MSSLCFLFLLQMEVEQLLSLSGSALAQAVSALLETPGLYVFSDILELPNVREVRLFFGLVDCAFPRRKNIFFFSCCAHFIFGLGHKNKFNPSSESAPFSASGNIVIENLHLTMAYSAVVDCHCVIQSCKHSPLALKGPTYHEQPCGLSLVKVAVS